MFGMLQEVLVWDLWVDGIPGVPYNLLFTVASIAWLLMLKSLRSWLAFLHSGIGFAPFDLNSLPQKVV